VITEEPVGAKIGKQVEQDLDTQEFTKRSTQLGSEVAQADREIDQRMHQVFDHHVSNLELMPANRRPRRWSSPPWNLPSNHFSTFPPRSPPA